ncbi:MAG: hypothetical protein OZ921_06865 [Sorangiineae bacterium]|nr:hypothetical protein [Polyangiaceae bacterium]MEB2322217.1 hypothetical protein [Sorangiineae bacterium]
MRISSWVGWVAVAAALTGGCRASVNANTSANVELHDDTDRDELEEGANTRSLATTTAETGDEPVHTGAMLGARHDLKLAAGARAAACSCLAAHVGPASDPAFSWEAAPPTLDAKTQLVVALTSEGVPCDAKTEGSLGASYWGYTRRGADVIVTVESARAGRPVTNGAVIPAPAPGGHVFIAPARRETPYGRPLVAGATLCQLH